MPDDLGLVNPVLSPILERVVREERLGRDLPRKQRERKSERSREEDTQTGDPPDRPEVNDTSMSSTHIDLRV
jgi:hypothetical protein